MAEITKTAEWGALENHFKDIKNSHMRDFL